MIEVGFQETLKNRLLNYFCGNSVTADGIHEYQIEIPENIYVGLFVSTGGQDPVELVIGSKNYERVPVTFTAPNAGVIRNNNRVTFPTATGTWTTETEKITHIALFDNNGVDPDTGDLLDPLEGLLVYQALASGESVTTGQTFELDTNCIKINLV